MDLSYLIIAQAADGGGLVSTLVMFGLVFLIFYFLLIRPQKKELTRHQTLVDSLKVGDEVMTSAGIFGTIKKVDADVVHLEIARGTTIKLARQKVHQSLQDFKSEAVPEKEKKSVENNEKKVDEALKSKSKDW